MTHIPCTKCRKRKETELELHELKIDHRKLEKKLTYRTNKIQDLQDTISRLRATTSSQRKMVERLKLRYSELLTNRDEVTFNLKRLRRRVSEALKEQ